MTGPGDFSFFSHTQLAVLCFCTPPPSPPILEQTEAPLSALPLPNFPTRRSPFRIVSPPPLSPYFFLGRRERVGERRPPILRRKATRLSLGFSGKESIGGHTCIKTLSANPSSSVPLLSSNYPQLHPPPRMACKYTFFPALPFAVRTSFPRSLRPSSPKGGRGGGELLNRNELSRLFPP